MTLILTVSRHLEAYIEEEENSKRGRTTREKNSRRTKRCLGRKNESFPPIRRVSFDGKSVKSHDWIIPSWLHDAEAEAEAPMCRYAARRAKSAKEKGSRWSRGRKRQGGWVDGWLVGLTPGVESKTRENKIHTRPLARLRFVHFIRANWIYLCGRLPHPWWGRGEVEMSRSR